MRRLSVFLCLLAATLAVASAILSDAAPVGPAKAVVGYIFAQNNALQQGEVDALGLTRVNYAFTNIENGRMVPGFAKDQENFAFLEALKQKNPSLTVLVSVGGWLWSTNFSDVSLTRQSRDVFIQSVMEFLTRYQLDGLDIDWEYPGMPGAGHPFRNEDKQNFTLLLQELRARFTAETEKTRKRLYLTIAAGASDEFIAHTEMAKVARYVDTVNLMAYDYYEPSSDAITGHHAPLFTNPADPKHISADASVHSFEKAGVPATKIVLGLPFYGHMWGQVADQNHGLYQPGKQVPNAYSNYGAITSTMLNNGFERYWDSTASVPYLYDPKTQVFVSYEDPESVEKKCDYVMKQRLGGVMFWDYEGDPSGVLLRVINSSFASHTTKKVATK